MVELFPALSLCQQLNRPEEVSNGIEHSTRNGNEMQYSRPEEDADQHAQDQEKQIKIEQIERAQNLRMSKNSQNLEQSHSQPLLNHSEAQVQNQWPPPPNQLNQQIRPQRQTLQLNLNRQQIQINRQRNNNIIRPQINNIRNFGNVVITPTNVRLERSDHNFNKINVQKVLKRQVRDITLMRLLNLFGGHHEGTNWPEKFQAARIVGYELTDTEFDNLYSLYEERRRNVDHIIHQSQSSDGNNQPNNINDNNGGNNQPRNNDNNSGNNQPRHNDNNGGMARRPKRKKYNNQTRPNNNRLKRKFDESKDENQILMKNLLKKYEEELSYVKKRLNEKEQKLEDMKENSAILTCEKEIYMNRLIARGLETRISNDELQFKLQRLGYSKRQDVSVIGKLM